MRTPYRSTPARLAVVLLTASLAACASLPATRGSQLPEEIPLTALADAPGVLAWRASPQALPSRYLLAPVRWEAAPSKAVDAADRRQLEKALGDALHAALAPLERADAAGPGVVVVKAAITGVDRSSPAANAALALLVGPADTGGASVSIRLDDGASGEPLAALVAAHNGGMFSVRGFRRWGHAEEAFKKAAARLPTLFAPAATAPDGSDER